MPDYKEMYVTLFQSVTAVISDLQEAQRQTEEMFISSPEPELTVLPRKESEDEVEQ